MPYKQIQLYTRITKCYSDIFKTFRNIQKNQFIRKNVKLQRKIIVHLKVSLVLH